MRDLEGPQCDAESIGIAECWDDHVHLLAKLAVESLARPERQLLATGPNEDFMVG